MMRSIGLLACAGALALASAVLQADRATAAQESAREQRVNVELDVFNKAMAAKDYEGALKAASKIELNDTKEARGYKAALRAAALLCLQRKTEAMQQFAQADELSPSESAITWLKFQSAVRAKQIDVANEAVDTMIARFPDEARDINQDLMWYLLGTEEKGHEQQYDDRRVALARIGYGGTRGDYLTKSAVRILLKRGDAANASDLVQYVDDPTAVEDMLITKRYSQLWPAIETMSGPHLEKVRNSSVEQAERDYAQDPSMENLHFLAGAFTDAGRLNDAIALRSKLPTTEKGMESADEDLGWAVNNVALALHQARRADEADALFALLNNAKIEKSSWRVSMIINRLELLVSDGKFAKAIELLPVAEATEGSPYAKQLVRRLKYCTLTSLGRKAEAAKVFPDMMEHAKDAYHATVDGLLCTGDMDGAEKLVLTAISDEDFQGQFVRAVQPVALTSHDPSIWNGRWKELRQRPAIAKEFERLGRDMPGNLVPPAAKSS